MTKKMEIKERKEHQTALKPLLKHLKEDEKKLSKKGNPMAKHHLTEKEEKKGGKDSHMHEKKHEKKESKDHEKKEHKKEHKAKK